MSIEDLLEKRISAAKEVRSIARRYWPYLIAFMVIGFIGGYWNNANRMKTENKIIERKIEDYQDQLDEMKEKTRWMKSQEQILAKFQSLMLSIRLGDLYKNLGNIKKNLRYSAGEVMENLVENSKDRYDSLSELLRDMNINDVSSLRDQNTEQYGIEHCPIYYDWEMNRFIVRERTLYKEGVLEKGTRYTRDELSRIPGHKATNITWDSLMFEAYMKQEGVPELKENRIDYEVRNGQYILNKDLRLDNELVLTKGASFTRDEIEPLLKKLDEDHYERIVIGLYVARLDKILAWPLGRR